MPRYEYDERYYTPFVEWLRARGVRKILMGGLGNAHLPRLLPDVKFVVMENDPSWPTPSGVTRILGDWYTVTQWPEESFDAFVDDISGAGLGECLQQFATRNQLYALETRLQDGPLVVHGQGRLWQIERGSKYGNRSGLNVHHDDSGGGHGTG